MLLHAIVQGRVQGVGYRYWLREQAVQMGLTGWVRNLPDGTVEVEAEGTDDELFEFEQVLWRGPALSRVDNVACSRPNGERNFARFMITS